MSEPVPGLGVEGRLGMQAQPSSMGLGSGLVSSSRTLQCRL